MPKAEILADNCREMIDKLSRRVKNALKEGNIDRLEFIFQELAELTRNTNRLYYAPKK